MRNCRDISLLVSKGLDKDLSTAEQFSVGLHILICARCRHFRTQSRFIRKVAHRYTEQLQNQLGKNHKGT